MFTKVIILIKKRRRQMYPRIPCELVVNPLGAAEHSLGTIGLAG